MRNWLGKWIGRWLGNWLGFSNVPPIPLGYLNLRGEFSHLIAVAGGIMEPVGISGGFARAFSLKGDGRQHLVQKAGGFGRSVDLSGGIR